MSGGIEKEPNGVEREPTDIEHEPIDERTVGIVETQTGPLKVTTDLEGLLRVRELESLELERLPKMKERGLVLDLSWAPRVEIFQLHSDPTTAKELVAPVGETAGLINWNGRNLMTDLVENDVILSPQLIAQLALKSLPGEMDRAGLFNFFNPDSNLGVQYAIVEFLTDAGDTMEWVSVREDDIDAIASARVFFLHPKARAVDDGMARVNSKEALRDFWLDLRKEVLLLANDEELEWLAELVDRVVAERKVKFRKNQLDLDPLDLSLLKQLYKTAVITAAWLGEVHEEYNALWQNLIQFKDDSWWENMLGRVGLAEPSNRIEFGVGQFRALMMVDPRQEYLFEEVEEETRSGDKREDLLAVLDDPGYTVTTTGQKLPEGFRRVLYEASEIYRKRWQREHPPRKARNYTKQVDVMVKPEVVAEMSADEILYEIGWRLWRGIGYLGVDQRHSSGISYRMKDNFLEIWRSLKILVSQFEYVEISSAGIKLPPFNHQDNRMVKHFEFANFNPHQVLDVFEKLEGWGSGERMDCRTWVLESLRMWREIFLPLRGYIGERSKPRMSYTMEPKLSRLSSMLGVESSKLAESADLVLDLMQGIELGTRAKKLSGKDLDALSFSTAEVLPLQLAMYGLAAEFLRLAEAGASNAQFKDFAQFVKAVAEGIIEDEVLVRKREQWRSRR